MIQKLSGRSKKVQKRLEILRAAAGKFRESGFDRTGMRDIADAVGLAVSNVYYYFRNKDEILYFCQDYSLDRMLEIADEVEKSKQPADLKLTRLIMGQMRCMLDELQGTAAHAEFASLPARLLKKVVAKRDKYEQVLRRVIEEGVASKVFKPCDVKLVSLAMLGAMNWSIKWYRPEGRRSVDEISGEFADYLVRGLK